MVRTAQMFDPEEMVLRVRGDSSSPEPVGTYRNLCFIGADPGFNGAIALVSYQSEVITVLDMPTITIKKGRKKRRYLDLPSLAESLRHALVLWTPSMAIIEDVHAMPKQGVVTTFQFGRSLGALEGVLSGLNIPYSLVTPQRWKGIMLPGLVHSDKSASLLQARRMMPSSKTWLTKVKHDGRAEAILLAEYARRVHTGAV